MKARLMKAGFAFCALPFAAVAAVPGVSSVEMSSKASGAVTIAYELTGAPAVVTMTFSANGQVVGTSGALGATGAVNALVQPGHRKAALAALPAGATVENLEVSVRAWATNCPPDYVVFALDDAAHPVRYYVSSNDVPDGVTAAKYKTTHLVMRRIPAANVEWRMGSHDEEGATQSKKAGDANRNCGEAHRYVRLTRDFYLGIYPVTYLQHKLIVSFGCEFGLWSKADYKDYRKDDMPYAPTQFVSLRSWMHDNDKGCTGDCGVHINCWPADGHAIDTNNSPKCVKSGGTYTPYLRKWRDTLGFMFDIPTEAEWEFACRAGTDAITYAKNPARDNYSAAASDLGDYAWMALNTTNETLKVNMPQSVGLKKPNAFGLYDMLGNVWEWCLDVQNSYATKHSLSAETLVDPEGETQIHDRNAYHILRGGSFCANADACRPAARYNGSCTYVDNSANADPTVFNAGTETAKWQNGYRLWMPSEAVR